MSNASIFSQIIIIIFVDFFLQEIQVATVHDDARPTEIRQSETVVRQTETVPETSTAVVETSATKAERKKTKGGLFGGIFKRKGSKGSAEEVSESTSTQQTVVSEPAPVVAVSKTSQPKVESFDERQRVSIVRLFSENQFFNK